MLPDAKPAAQTDFVQLSMTAQNDSVSVKTNPTPIAIGTAMRNPDPEGKTTVSKTLDKPGKGEHKKPKAVMKKRD